MYLIFLPYLFGLGMKDVQLFVPKEEGKNTAPLEKRVYFFLFLLLLERQFTFDLVKIRTVASVFPLVNLNRKKKYQSINKFQRSRVVLRFVCKLGVEIKFDVARA